MHVIYLYRQNKQIMRIIHNKTSSIVIVLLILGSFPDIALSEIITKEICFNFYIVTKASNQETEKHVFEKQKKLIYKQLSNIQMVFDNNQERHCPDITFYKGIVNQIKWEDALKFSQPIDQDINESRKAYLLRKSQKISEKLVLITKKLHAQPDIKYRSFIDLHPGRVIAKAENALLNIKEIEHSKQIEASILNSISEIRKKLDAYGKEDSAETIRKAKERLATYDEIDQASKRAWEEGELIFWNDIEAQITSVELKNLVRLHRTPENQCLDVYVVPSGKTPSRSIKEANKNKKWTQRGGAALSSRNFPRTTAGRGPAIILTYNSSPNENRLAHEFGHLLLSKGDAHENKKEKDLMHENSRGGSYLNEMECNDISENIMTLIN